ncbi:hypothetical protein EDC02_2180 [Micromonospora sp. Llam0]|uniref:hypothetical protein n=1 Tax=Micromonospora sp. Llam0 TaxID=2485143 RepID=UPI000F48571A|nr:hypothetical protein [Micromonospora sp. Llam0]ROO60319.1 hypothetical protein EDC02_2180 [Micromonospora sp. Llam0]
MGDWLADQLIGPILTWFAETVIGVLNALWDLLRVTAFVSPDVTALPQVTAFASTSLGIVNVCYVLAFLWTAILVMGRDTVQSQVGPGELIPRLVIGLIAANFAIPLSSTIIGLANALTAALTSQDITASGSMEHLRSTTVGALNGQVGASPVSFLLLFIGLLIAVFAGILLVQWIIRIGVLVVAVGIAPIALALHGTPQTEGAAKLWWRTILGTLGTVVLQAVALHTTLTVFLAPDSNLQVLGLPIPGGDPAAIMNLLIVVCLLFGVVKIPGLMSRYITRTPSNPVGTVLRVVLVQQVTRGISRVFNAGKGAMTATGRSSGGAGGAAAASGPWPVSSGGGGQVRSRPAASSPGPLAAGSAPRPSPRPTGAGPGRAGAASPTGRAVRPYTRDEIAGGVDLYTRTVRKRAAPAVPASARPQAVAEPTRSEPSPVSPRVTPATAMPRTRPVRQPVTGKGSRPVHTR